MEEIKPEEIRTYLHDIVNKSVACQSYLRLLQKKELGEKETELVNRAYDSLMQSFDIIKELRSKL